MKPPVAYMIAESLLQADLTARIDWGWERIGHGKRRRPDGLEVRYAASEENLRGISRGTLVFCGHRWERHIAFAAERGLLSTIGKRLRLTTDPKKGLSP